MIKIHEFFEAKSIAVIGASREKEKVGHIIFDNLLENRKLKVYPVNPNADEISGVKCYPDVMSIPYSNVDMAVIAVKAEFVPVILEQCGRKGVKSAIIISAGFSEAGNNDLAFKIKAVADKNHIKILGPNVLGIIDSYSGLNASFFREIPLKGKIGIISQSGAVGTALLDKAIDENLGISSFISLGNMQGESFISSLKYLRDNRNTEVILLYIESLKEKEGREFVEICKEITKKKKIIAIKAGKTEAGEKAAKTHTASLSSPAEIYSGAFEQAGIIEVNTLEELFLTSRILSKYNKIGKRALIITNAGGLGVLSADYCFENNLILEKISEEILKEMDKFLPKGYSRSNPLDILGDALAERYERVIKIFERSNLFDFFIVIMSPQEMTQPTETAWILPKIKKPVFACLIGGKSLALARRFLHSEGIIYFEELANMAKVLGYCAE